MHRRIMRRRLLITVLLGGCMALSAAVRPCMAREPFVEFLRGLQKHGFGEQGLTYLDQVAERPDLPDDLSETLDLERSKCLRIAAAEAYDAQQRTARLAESKRLAEKFFTEHPNHPAAGTVLLNEGDEALARGEQRLGLARGAREKEVQAKAFQEARAALTEARGRYEVAITRLKERVDSLPKPAAGEKPDTPAARQREEFSLPWIEARSKCAISEYLLAQTISDEKDP